MDSLEGYMPLLDLCPGVNEWIEKREEQRKAWRSLPDDWWNWTRVLNCKRREFDPCVEITEHDNQE